MWEWEEVKEKDRKGSDDGDPVLDEDLPSLEYVGVVPMNVYS